MNTKQLANELAEKCATVLQRDYDIGVSTRFCDDAPDWDSATTEDIAKILLRELNLENLLKDKMMLDWLENDNEHWHEMTDSLFDKSKLGGYAIRDAIQQAIESEGKV